MSLIELWVMMRLLRFRAMYRVRVVLRVVKVVIVARVVRMKDHWKIVEKAARLSKKS